MSDPLRERMISVIVKFAPHIQARAAVELVASDMVDLIMPIIEAELAESRQWIVELERDLADCQEVATELYRRGVALAAARERIAELDGRLGRIAEAHSKNVDSSGGSWGDCVECGWSWPCPTHIWATKDQDVLAPWNPNDDEDDDD